MIDLNKEKREPFFGVVGSDWDHRDCRTGDSLQKDIFEWLSAPDPWKNYHAACKSRHRGTADWFIEGNTFSDWKMSEEGSSLLWVHGKRLLISGFCGSTGTKMVFCFGFAAGAGKSVFWYVIFLYLDLGNLLCSSVPPLLKTSVPCRKLDSRH